MKKILAGIIALSMSVCMFSCSDSKEENNTDDSSVSSVDELSGGEENIADGSSVSSADETSGEEETPSLPYVADSTREENFTPEEFAPVGYEKINEIINALKGDGLELSDVCIYSTDDTKNFNITDSTCELIRSEMEKYNEMETGYPYFFVIQDYKCSYFVCTDGIENGVVSNSGTYTDLNYEEIYNVVFDEISVQ